MIFFKGKLNSKGPSSVERLVERLFYTPYGAIIVSGLFGMALAMMFQRVCKDNKCIVIQAPPQKEIRDYIYQLKNDECFKYTPKVVRCA